MSRLVTVWTSDRDCVAIAVECEVGASGVEIVAAVDEHDRERTRDVLSDDVWAERICRAARD